jgi:hypothetical protein
MSLRELFSSSPLGTVGIFLLGSIYATQSGAGTGARVLQAIERLADAGRELRQLRSPVDGLADPLAQRALLSIATSARRRES